MELLQGIDWGAKYHFEHKRLPWLDPLIGPGDFLASYGGFLLLAGAIFFMVVVLQRRWVKAARLALILTLASGSVELVRRVVSRERPDVAIRLVGSSEMNLSFPSRGVFLATLGLLLLAMVLERTCRRRADYFVVYSVVLALIGYVAFSQLYFSVHFVTDVVAGIVAGCAVAMLTRSFCAEGPG